MAISAKDSLGIFGEERSEKEITSELKENQKKADVVLKKFIEREKAKKI